MKQSNQLPLKIQLTDELTFDNYWSPAGTENYQVGQALKNFSSGATDDWFIYLWGVAGTGCSHLLQASCLSAIEQNISCQYLPLNSLNEVSPSSLFESLDEMQLLCIDNIDAVVGKPDWEEALFNLFNRLQQKQSRLLVSAQCAPAQLSIHLPDLQSRLTWGTVYRLHALDDEQKKQALQMRAQSRGMLVSDEVASYLLSRTSREMDDLIALLDLLDQQSLAEQRALTIPFVRQVLAG